LWVVMLWSALRDRFNPHPARRPSATSQLSVMYSRSETFQSPPGPKAECYHSPSASLAPMIRFQSPPGPKAECYQAPTDVAAKTMEVSIPTQPEGRVLRPQGGGGTMTHNVSIPTRPEGRVLRQGEPTDLASLVEFQSPPGPKAECY